MRFDVTAYPYQAKGDGIADDGPAIQAAIDACARAGTAQYGAAQGTVWFPTGTYRVTGTLYLPQLWSMFSVTLAGEGVDGAIVVKDTPGDLFVADRRPGHAPQAIDLVVRDLALACLPQSSCLTWDMRDVVDWRSGTGRIRLAMSRVRLRCGTGGSSAPAMRLYGGGGVTLRDVWVYGVSGSHGVAFEFERCSRTSLYDCRIMGVPGGLCRFIGSGGTQTLVGCRAEGAYDVPEFLFEDQNSVVLINCGGEGEGESPSQFLFRRCTEVELIDCSPSTADKDPPGGGARPDGIRFEACSGVRVSGGAAPGSYTAQGAKAIRIGGDCHAVVVEGFRTASAGEVVIEPGATECRVEVLTSGGIVERIATSHPAAVCDSFGAPAGKPFRSWVDAGYGWEFFDRANPLSPLLSFSRVGNSVTIRTGLTSGTPTQPPQPLQLRWSNPVGAIEFYYGVANVIATQTLQLLAGGNAASNFRFRANVLGLAFFDAAPAPQPRIAPLPAGASADLPAVVDKVNEILNECLTRLGLNKPPAS